MIDIIFSVINGSKRLSLYLSSDTALLRVTQGDLVSGGKRIVMKF